MDGTAPESHASGSQVHPALRHRMLSRAATFAEGAQSSKSALARRRSSVLSDFSDTRQSLQSSTENLLRANGKNDMNKPTSLDEPTHWISIPIVAAIVPAVVGLTYENGAAIATDILMLALASWFLHWCVRVPWDWYHEAQQQQYVYSDLDDMHPNDTIFEEDEGSIEIPDDQPEPAADDKQDLKLKDSDNLPPVTDAQRDAREQLKRQELFAFTGCFLGPFIGALLLHTIRGQLTRAEGIVSNFNLVIFFLGAELKPCRRLIEMKKQKILHLQRIVQLDLQDQLKPADAQQLSLRLAEVEAQLDRPMANSEADILKVSADVRQSMQLQLDALNRAVRRYEKRHMAQSIQLEARFHEVDMRLKDALSLAAAAARTGQRPGIVSMTISWVVGLINYLLQTAWCIVTYPFRTATAAIVLVRSLFVKSERQPRRRGKGHVNGYSSMSSPRMQSKSGR